MRVIWFLLWVLSMCSSCGDSGDKIATVSLAEEVDTESRDSIFYIKDGGMSFQVLIPAEVLVHGPPSLRFNSSSGEYEILDAAKQVWLLFSPETRPWMEILRQIEDNDLFKIDWVEKSDNRALYNRILPDSVRYDQMIVAMFESVNQRLLVTSSPAGEHSESDIKKMVQILSTLKLQE